MRRKAAILLLRPRPDYFLCLKHGIIGLTKTAAVEYASKGIRVNAVCPGTLHTDWVGRVTDKLNKAHHIGRTGMPEEVAEAIIWLSSEKSSFVTAHSLVVDAAGSAVKTN